MGNTEEWTEKKFLTEADKVLEGIGVARDSRIWQTNLEEGGYYTMKAGVFFANSKKYWICFGRCDPINTRVDCFAGSIEADYSGLLGKAKLMSVKEEIERILNPILPTWNKYKKNTDRAEIIWRYTDGYDRKMVIKHGTKIISLVKRML
ncbi:MAG: hypothetical protein CXT72_04445 [Methanobacteriota archaeon]|nr:MAG: hypothetical protein CXT72_04445 [Euryarchaeota archaeon]HIG03915.1 hypothetical protein [Candidatus Poseidoniales archaeon]